MSIEPTSTNKGKVEIIEIKDNQVVTKYNKTFIERYHNFMINYPNWDIYMILELIIFFFSFIFLVTEKIKDRNFFAGSYLFYINSILLLDFLFRMLSIRIESIKREYWNNTLLCIIPLIMWLLSAYYGFDNVYGGQPVQVLNVLIFIILNLIVFIIILLNLLKKGKKEESDIEDINDVESSISMR